LQGGLLKREVFEFIPIAYIPLPKRNNPVVVVKTSNTAIIELDENEGENLEIWGVSSNELINLVAAFTSRMKEETGVDVGFKIKVYLSKEINDAFLYVAITNMIIEYLGGGLDKEMIESAQVIDKEVGSDDSIMALREYNLHAGKPYIWRRGEGAITLGKKLMFDADVVDESDMEFIEPVNYDIVTHLAGLSSISFFNVLKGKENLRRVVRLMNALWYLVYGVTVPDTGKDVYVVVKGLGKAYITLVRKIVGVGDDEGS
jgi:hypothetical protein